MVWECDDVRVILYVPCHKMFSVEGAAIMSQKIKGGGLDGLGM